MGNVALNKDSDTAILTFQLAPKRPFTLEPLNFPCMDLLPLISTFLLLLMAELGYKTQKIIKVTLAADNPQVLVVADWFWFAVLTGTAVVGAKLV